MKLKPGLVAQQSQPSSDNRGCAAFLRFTNSSTHALHTDETRRDETRGGKEHHRETIRACGQATQKSTICRTATTTASLKHQSLRSLREYHLLYQWTSLIMRKFDGKSMLRRMSVTTSSRRRPQVKRRWILWWVPRNSAGSPRGWTQLSTRT